MVRRELANVADNVICIFLNPKIIEKDKTSRTTVKEGCMSFPFRPEKKMRRYGRVKVSYDQISDKGELVHKEEWVENLIAQIFQHECEHANGITIY